MSDWLFQFQIKANTATSYAALIYGADVLMEILSRSPEGGVNNPIIWFYFTWHLGFLPRPTPYTLHSTSTVYCS